MQATSKLLDCYQLINDTSFDQCLLEASKMVGVSSSIQEIRRNIEGRSLFDPIIIGKNGGQEIKIKDLFNEFEKTSHLRIRSTFREMDYWLMETLVQQPDKESKSSFFSDVYLILTYLKIDIEYINKGGVIPKGAPAYNSPLCPFPFQRNYYSQLYIKIQLQLKKLKQRFGIYLSDEIRTYISPDRKIQSFNDLYDILEFERPLRAGTVSGKPLSPFQWAKHPGDLIELITALSLAECIKTTKGSVPRTQLIDFFTDIFGMKRIQGKDFTDRSNKNLKRKVNSAKFLTVLIEAYKKESQDKKNIRRKNPTT